MSHGRAPYLVAEVGVNHDGDFERAADMLRKIAKVGFDGVKFQYWIEDELLAVDAPNAPYQGPGNQRDLLRSLELSLDELSRLREMAKGEGLAFGITADGTRALQDATSLQPDFIKVGSGDADNPWLLDAVAQSGRPVVLSVGMSSDEDVMWMVERLKSVGDLTVLHCVTAYPTPVKKLNLWRMRRFSEMTDRPVGLSDHTIGVAAASAAVALGASMVEKHVTWNQEAPGPDHAASLPLDAAGSWTTDVRGVYEAISSSTFLSAETENRAVVRKALYLARDLETGDTIDEDDLLPLRPLLDGIPARHRDEVVGRKLAKPVPAGTRLMRDDLV